MWTIWSGLQAIPFACISQYLNMPTEDQGLSFLSFSFQIHISPSYRIEWWRKLVVCYVLSKYQGFPLHRHGPSMEGYHNSLPSQEEGWQSNVRKIKEVRISPFINKKARLSPFCQATHVCKHVRNFLAKSNTCSIRPWLSHVPICMAVWEQLVGEN